MTTIYAIAYAAWQSLPAFLLLAIVSTLAVICDEARRQGRR